MKRIMRFLGGAALAGMLILLPGHASALMFDLNTLINGNALTPTTSWGTVSITDNGGSVDILVDLIGGGNLKIQNLYLNYDDAKFSNLSSFTLTGTTVAVDENNQKAGGYSLGMFDLQIPATGNLGFEPFLGTLSLGGVILTEADFNFLDTTSGELYAAAHIGSLSDGSSIWVGSGDGAPPPVPEPATILLLGGGLLGLALHGKRRMKT